MKDSLVETIDQLKQARANLDRIRTEYKENPQLVNFYEPSARFLVTQLEMRLKSEIAAETGLSLNTISESQDVDIWVSIEGKEFTKGRGPIGQVGIFLNKLNQANRYVGVLLKRKWIQQTMIF